MVLLPDKKTCGLRMHQDYRERLLRHWLQRKSLVSNPGTYHDTCVTHVPWFMSGSLTRVGGENVSGIPGGCATRICKYILRGLCHSRVFGLETQCHVRFRLFRYSDICVKLLLMWDICFEFMCFVAWNQTLIMNTANYFLSFDQVDWRYNIENAAVYNQVIQGT